MSESIKRHQTLTVYEDKGKRRKRDIEKYTRLTIHDNPVIKQALSTPLKLGPGVSQNESAIHLEWLKKAQPWAFGGSAKRSITGLPSIGDELHTSAGYPGFALTCRVSLPAGAGFLVNNREELEVLAKQVLFYWFVYDRQPVAYFLDDDNTLDKTKLSKRVLTRLTDKNIKKFNQLYPTILNDHQFQAMYGKSSYIAIDDYILNLIGRQPLTLGFDCEWIERRQVAIKGENYYPREALTYQFYYHSSALTVEVLYYAPDHKRISAGDLLYDLLTDEFKGYGFVAVRQGRSAHAYTPFEEAHIRLVGHFVGVDISMLSDWKDLVNYSGLSQEQLDEIAHLDRCLQRAKSDQERYDIRRDIAVIQQKSRLSNNVFARSKHNLYTTTPRPLNVWPSKVQGRVLLRITIRDSMELCSKSSLAKLGDSLNIPKIDLGEYSERHGKPADYYITHMDELYRQDFQKFFDYALRDAEISLKWYKQFCRDLHIPDAVTVSSASATLVKNYIKASQLLNNDLYDALVRGFVYDAQTGEPDYQAYHPDTVGVMGSMPANHFAGGFNSSFYSGFYPKPTADFDIRSAYPYAMAITRMPNYFKPLKEFKKGHEITTQDIDGFGQMGWGYCDITFPDGSIPFILQKSKDSKLKGSPYYAQEIEKGLVSAPEVLGALMVGAKVRVRSVFYLYQMYDERHPIGEANKNLIDKRAQAKALQVKRCEAAGVPYTRSTQEQMFKLACNGVYGKTGQGLYEKRARNIIIGNMEDILPSKITDPALASHTTAVVRTILGLMLNKLTDLGYDIISVTTDGFISSFPEDEVDKLSEILFNISPEFKEAMDYLWNGKETSMFEVKHTMPNGVVNMKTRANISLNSKGVFAGGGYRGTPEFRQMSDDEPAKRAFMVNLWLNRDGRVKDTITDMISLHEMKTMTDRDFNTLRKSKEDDFKYLSLDYDTKAFLLPAVGRYPLRFSSEQGEVDTGVSLFPTRPFKDEAEFVDYAKKWAKFINMGYNMKTESDYKAWEKFLAHGFPSHLPKHWDKHPSKRYTYEQEQYEEDFILYAIRQFFRAGFQYPKDLAEDWTISRLARSEWGDKLSSIYPVDKGKVLRIYDSEKRKRNPAVDLKAVWQVLGVIQDKQVVHK